MEIRKRFTMCYTLVLLTACMLQPLASPTSSAVPGGIIAPTASTLPAIAPSPTIPAAVNIDRTNIITWGLDGMPNDTSFEPSISADGRFVAFLSYATNLTDNVDPDRTYPDNPADVFLADLTEQTVTLISRTRDGSAAESSGRPLISRDGRYIIFSSAGTGLTDERILSFEINDEEQYVSNVYCYDRESDTITLVTRSVAGNESADGSSGVWDVSPDGGAILIESWASNLTHDILPETGSFASYLYLYEAASDTMTLISLDEAGRPYEVSRPAFSPDGNLVYYEISKDDTHTVNDAYIYNRLTGQRRLVGPVFGHCGWWACPNGRVLNDGTVAVIAGPEQDPRYTQGGVYLIAPMGEEIRKISEPHPLAKPPSVHHCCLRAGGNTIAFVQVVGEYEYRLFVYRLDTSTLTEISSGFSPENVVREMVLSPEAVLFMVEEADFDFSKQLRPLSTLYRYDVTTGRVNALTDNRSEYWISEDGASGYLSLPAVADETERVVYMTFPVEPDGFPGFGLLAYVDP